MAILSLNARIGITEEQFNKLTNIISTKSEEVSLEEFESVAVMLYIRRFAEQIYKYWSNLQKK